MPTTSRWKMKKTIEEYLAFCKEQGKESEEPLTDKALVHAGGRHKGLDH